MKSQYLFCRGLGKGPDHFGWRTNRCCDPEVGINLVCSKNRGTLWLMPGKVGRDKMNQEKGLSAKSCFGCVQLTATQWIVTC